MFLYKEFRIGEHERGLLYVEGRFERVLEPGLHQVYRLFRRQIGVVRVDMRVRTVQVTGQELMTADAVTLRMNLVGRYRVRDPAAALHEVEDYPAQIYTDLQLALRDAVGALALDELLARKGGIGRRVAVDVRDKAAAYGLELRDVGLKDLVLPGDMKAILNQVLEARKRAESAQIARREEVAATRSLANTAAMLEKNPTLMRLKEMELLEKVLAGYGNKVLLGLPERLQRLIGLEGDPR
jgi:regulator of protease activity HflC (stomatin/prohibitin superfamily)